MVVVGIASSVALTTYVNQRRDAQLRQAALELAGYLDRAKASARGAGTACQLSITTTTAVIAPSGTPGSCSNQPSVNLNHEAGASGITASGDTLFTLHPAGIRERPDDHLPQHPEQPHPGLRPGEQSGGTDPQGFPPCRQHRCLQLCRLVLISAGLPRRRPSHAGFSVLEVLLTLVASTLVATGIGSLMVSSVRSQARIETYNRLQGSWYQAANLLEAEAGLAERLQSATTASTGCSNLASADVKLVLVGPGNAWRSYYGVRARTGGEATLWYGPNLLVRCGRPLTTNAVGAPAHRHHRRRQRRGRRRQPAGHLLLHGLAGQCQQLPTARSHGRPSSPLHWRLRREVPPTPTTSRCASRTTASTDGTTTSSTA